MGSLLILTCRGWAQSPLPVGRFLTDSIELGRPFQYALVYRHRASLDVLFPDTARHFFPFRVRQVTTSATKTTGEGQNAISRDSAVYTLISFETEAVQPLQVPIRLVNATDCTTLFTLADTVFLRSRLAKIRQVAGRPDSQTLAVTTELVPLRQQLNYPVLGVVALGLSVVLALLYGFFGRAIRKQWILYQLRQRHSRFLREYNRLCRELSAETATDTANRAVISWKMYLERLEQQPYASLTTPEIAERTGDSRVAEALREADRMIYGGAFSSRSTEALRILRDVADQAYNRHRTTLIVSAGQPESLAQPDSAESSTAF